MGVKNVVKKIADRAGNRVASLAALSSAQVDEIQSNREAYLFDKPSVDDVNAAEITQRMIAASSIEVFNAYLSQIKDLYTPVENNAEYDRPFDADHNIRYFNITKWVVDNKENGIEKLVNVYATLSNEDCNIALVFNRTKQGTNVYIAVTNLQNADNNVDSELYKNRLIEGIRGNFPGVEFKDDGKGIIPCLKNDNSYSVAMASNIPTEKSEKFISQTIEKLLDGIIPDSKKTEYTLVLLATPIRDVEERKLRLGEFYSGLAPYASWQTDYHFMDNQAFGSGATVGVNVGASAGIQNGTNYSMGESSGVTDNTARTQTDSSNSTITKGESASTAIGSNESTNIEKGYNSSQSFSGTVGVNLGGTATATAGGEAGESLSTGKTTGTSTTNTSGWTKSAAESTGRAVANTLGKAVSKTISTTTGIAKSTNFGANFGANFARSSTVTAMVGKTEGITQTFTNYNIKHALDLLESQMKRLEQSTALGMWDFAAYVLSEDQSIANNVAHSYLALTLGEESYMSKSAINLWRGKDSYEKERAKVITSYIRELRHPVFALNPDIVAEDGTFNVYPSVVTATTSLSGKELAYSLNFPQKSVSGLPILNCAEFGRNVVSYDVSDCEGEQLKLGKIFHMNHTEKNDVDLKLESLKSHTFVTGSTGSGKSNTVYHILENSREKGVHFLVIEPAKGEYKHVFCNEDVAVYGTNPISTPLLRLNPFSFPKKIHILEHLDRLIEIFNVCWPMYAAMPAVLKSAVEKSYVDSGWDLISSTNKYDKNLYPSFKDVALNIKAIIESSEYDNENKGAYKGSLLTRLQSLTTGINGLIFSPYEISDEELFNRNVIVDLSRVGSSETKSLIMGMLVLKLQEFRMSEDTYMNSPIRHITVLEEAHNLLRRTSIEQSSESANILGKSVEMLANAIAEMRTYGEGFVIVDQAPGLMDMSVIRNTNTKIIMRLPDKSDRELVGKAANLDDDQIKELAKLPCGVAAVYQNEWVQPVLCKVDKHNSDDSPYELNTDNNGIIKMEDELSSSLLKCIMDKELYQRGDKEDLRELKDVLIKSTLDLQVKLDFVEYINAEKEKGIEKLRVLVYDFLKAENAINESKQYDDIHDWVNAVLDKLDPSINEFSKKQIDLVTALILHEKTIRDRSYQDIYCRFTEVYKNGGGIF